MIGRDRLFRLLKEEGMLIKRKKRFCITTNSNHPFKKHKNLIKDLDISRKNQVWASDITYIRVGADFCYASLITDMYTRKIVGYDLSDSLAVGGTIRALKRAFKQGVPEYHHSDRGSQYCSGIYTEMLRKKKVKISMTENGNCYENALAERINGILKYEFGLKSTFKTQQEAKKALEQAIFVYNSLRPHEGLSYKTPSQLYDHNHSGIGCWGSYSKRFFDLTSKRSKKSFGNNFKPLHLEID